MGRHTGINSIEKVSALGGLLDVGVNEQRVGFGVDVLHHDLETVEASSLGNLNLSAKTLNQVLIDDTVRGGKECQDMGNEIFLVFIEAVVPVVHVLGQVNLLSRPERGLGFLVHLPDL